MEDYQKMNMTLLEYARKRECDAISLRGYMETLDDERKRAFYAKYMEYGDNPDGSDTYLHTYVKSQLDKDFDRDKFWEEHPEYKPIEDEPVENTESITEKETEKMTKMSNEEMKEKFRQAAERARANANNTEESPKDDEIDNIKADEEYDDDEEEYEESYETVEDTAENEEAENTPSEDFINKPEPAKEPAEEPKEEKPTKPKKAKAVKEDKPVVRKKKSKLNPPKGYFASGTEENGGLETIQKTRKFLVANGMKLDEVAFLSDEETKETFNKEYLVLEYMGETIVIRREALEGIREDIFLPNTEE